LTPDLGALQAGVHASLVIGGIEVLSLLTHQIAEPSRSHALWASLSSFDLNTAPEGGEPLVI
jgi:hypothetical protein